MQKAHFFFFVILVFATQIMTAQSQRYWQIGLQGRVGDFWLDHGIGGGDDVDNQYALYLSFDRAFNKYFGAGLSLGYVHILDKRDFGGASFGQHSFDASNKFKVNLLSLSLSPIISLPLKGNGAISLRPYGGIGLIKSQQQMFYSFNVANVTSSKSETYDYKPNWMPVAGLFGEYTLHFSAKWSAFISIGYEHHFAMRSTYLFDNQELPYSEFPLTWQSTIRNIREVSDEWDRDMHQFRDFSAPQIGVGIRRRWIR